MNKPANWLECEKTWVYATLIGVAGFLGGFTYLLRGGVFCNAQTLNLLLLGLSVGEGDWSRALYLLFPLTAYVLGGMIAEAVAGPIRKLGLIRWETLLLFLETLLIVVLGLIPDAADFRISQVLTCFLCSMQYATFRQSKGVSMATTFCTNHLRQFSIALMRFIKHRERGQLVRFLDHLLMLAAFAAGGCLCALLCRPLGSKVIFLALIPLAVLLAKFLYADLHTEKDRLDQLPQGF